MNSVSAQNQSSVGLDAIGQIAITISDLDRSTAFYRDTLGMKFLFNAGHMAFFQCGSVRLMIGTSDQPFATGGIVLYFKVRDIQASHASLTDANVSILQKPHLIAKMPDHDLWMSFFKDPDGHTLALMSEVPRNN